MEDIAKVHAKRLEIVRRRAIRTIGDEQFVEAWLSRPNVWLGDTPVNLMATAEGFDAVKIYLFQVGHGVHT